MSIVEVLNALRELDDEDDEHWTEDGLPRVDVVAKLLPGCTRQHIAAAAPKFNRSNPELPPDPEEIRKQKQAAYEEAQRKTAEAKQREEAARLELQQATDQTRQLSDSHLLTRQNQAWLAAQMQQDQVRMERGRVIDQLVKDAGGPKAIGRHPIEVNTGARIRESRKRANQNFVAKPQQ